MNKLRKVLKQMSQLPFKNIKTRSIYRQDQVSLVHCIFINSISSDCLESFQKRLYAHEINEINVII